jgi:hypothetical protein
MQDCQAGEKEVIVGTITQKDYSSVTNNSNIFYFSELSANPPKNYYSGI